MCFQPLRHCFDRNLRGIFQRVAIHASRNCRECNTVNIMLFGKIQRIAVTIRQLHRIFCHTGVNWPYCMNDILCFQPVALSDFCFSGAAAVQRAALRQQFRHIQPVARRHDGFYLTSETLLPAVVLPALHAEPVFITKNGKGDLAVMSIETYEALTARFDLYAKLQEGLELGEGRGA